MLSSESSWFGRCEQEQVPWVTGSVLVSWTQIHGGSFLDQVTTFSPVCGQDQFRELPQILCLHSVALLALRVGWGVVCFLLVLEMYRLEKGSPGEPENGETIFSRCL